ncbi:HTTM domain-containing protein [Haladaptatus sp. YSMS36]|uniref:HTTM domain-containing protein n=1 Tax=Haladaptatus sp. YSMS36 TaxID=3033384 RepID=UPI0023E77CE6|nr:HTTM domain-containing protein [Haladaptatus sp. YSMS36]
MTPPFFRASRRSVGWRRLAEHVGIDVRALAALRISLGVLLLADLSLRSRHLVAFYTDAGVLPRSALQTMYPRLSHLSLHALSGSAWMQGVLFFVAGVAALALLVGYRTRVATLCLLLLLVSLHIRNPLVLSAGDVLLRRLLFWSLFLPLGARWSVDSRELTAPQASRVVSMATVGLLVQTIVVYSVNAVLKLRGDAWTAGTAIQSVFQVDYLTVFLGDELAQFPTLLSVFGTLWLVLVICAPLLVVLRGRARTALALLFVGMHVGMALTLRIGLFPLVSIASLLVFFPAGVWNQVERTTATMVSRSRGSRSDLSSHDEPEITAHPLRTRAVTILATLVIVVMLLVNATALGVVAIPTERGEAVAPDSTPWRMFAPTPPNEDSWFVAPGRLESGGQVDAFQEGAVSWTRPVEVSGAYPSARWRKYLEHVENREVSDPGNLATYLCHRWNANHDTTLQTVSVVQLEHSAQADSEKPRSRTVVANQSCVPQS